LDETRGFNSPLHNDFKALRFAIHFAKAAFNLLQQPPHTSSFNLSSLKFEYFPPRRFSSCWKKMKSHDNCSTDANYIKRSASASSLWLSWRPTHIFPVMQAEKIPSNMRQCQGLIKTLHPRAALGFITSTFVQTGHSYSKRTIKKSEMTFCNSIHSTCHKNLFPLVFGMHLIASGPWHIKTRHQKINDIKLVVPAGFACETENSFGSTTTK
jgi:hypothetical protein